MIDQRETFLNALQSVDAYEFEEFVADLWKEQGWNTEVTTGSNDRGVDIIATRETPFAQKIAIQAKRYDPGNTIGSPDIQQYASLRQQIDNVDAVVIVTTASYTSGAEELAESLNVKLIDGDQLFDIFTEHGGPDLLERYDQSRPTPVDTEVTIQTDDDTGRPASDVPRQDEPIDVSVEETTDSTTGLEPPSSLAEVISMGEDLRDDLKALSDRVEAADEAFEERNFEAAIETYGDAQQELLSVQSRVERYAEGFASIDTDAARHLSAPEEYESELASLRNRISERTSKAHELQEQAQALRTLAAEVESDAEDAIDAVEDGDRARGRGQFGTAVETYERAADKLDETYATLETYRALRDQYPHALPQSQPEPPEDIDLDSLETKIDDRLRDGDVGEIDESAAEAMHRSVQESLLEETHTGDGYTNDPPQSYVDHDEIVRFVFYSEIKGHTAESASGSKVRSRPDTDYGTVFVITNHRLLVITGTDGGDEVEEVSLPVRSEYSTGWSKNRLTVYPDFLGEGKAYHLWIDSEYDEDDLEAAQEQLLTRHDTSAYEVPQAELEALAEKLPEHVRRASRTGTQTDPGSDPLLKITIPDWEGTYFGVRLDEHPVYTFMSPDDTLFEAAVTWAVANDLEVELTGKIFQGSDMDDDEYELSPAFEAAAESRDPVTIQGFVAYFLDKVCGVRDTEFPTLEARLLDETDPDDGEGQLFDGSTPTEDSSDARTPTRGTTTAPSPERHIDEGTLAVASADAKAERAEELVEMMYNDEASRQDLMESPQPNSIGDGGGLYDKPLVDYLNQDEELRYLFTTRGSYGFSVGEKGDRIDPSTDGRAFHAITDERVVSAVGHEDGDETVVIPVAAIKEAEAHNGISKSRIEIETADETYHLWISNSHDRDDISRATSSL